MRYVWHKIWPVVLAVGLTLLAIDPASAQAPEPPAKVDKEVEEWLKILSGKIADRHDLIRDGARQAMVAVGRPALPTLKKLAAGEDAATAEAARKLIARIESGCVPGVGLLGIPCGCFGVPGGGCLGGGMVGFGGNVPGGGCLGGGMLGFGGHAPGSMIGGGSGMIGGSGGGISGGPSPSQKVIGGR